MKSPMLYHWTPERDAELIARMAAGQTQAGIARAFGWPAHAVADRVKRLRAERRLALPSTSIDRALIARFNAGEKVKSIARAMGMMPHAISTRIDRLRAAGRLPYRNRPWTTRESAALLDALDAGGRYARLAPIFGRSPQALRVFAMAARKARAEAEVADRDQFTLELRAA